MHICILISVTISKICPWITVKSSHRFSDTLQCTSLLSNCQTPVCRHDRWEHSIATCGKNFLLPGCNESLLLLLQWLEVKSPVDVVFNSFWEMVIMLHWTHYLYKCRLEFKITANFQRHFYFKWYLSELVNEILPMHPLIIDMQ